VGLPQFRPETRLRGLLARVPHERVPRAVQDLSARRANRHHRRQDCRIEAVGRQSRQELTVNCNRARLVVTAEMDRIGPDQGLKAARLLLDPRCRLGEGDKSLRTEAETGELEAIHREAIAFAA